MTRLPFILKGILGKRDAEKAIDIGAECLVVSNHGGSVIDYAAHALEVLPEVEATLEDRMKVLVDGGFRRGTDVAKALALGADGVLVGRVLVLSLAANLSDGVRDMIIAMNSELQRVMTLTGCANVPAFNSSILEIPTFVQRLQVQE
jgi:isopentenyl diphosphate isomerase/L-lactate dehydrogenase-like FMN-dependent dehydrogenase